MALAIDRRCFCPPDRFVPPSANSNSYLFSSFSTKSLPCAISIAFLMASLLGFLPFFVPRATLSSIVPLNITAFWEIYPILSYRLSSL